MKVSRRFVVCMNILSIVLGMFVLGNSNFKVYGEQGISIDSVTIDKAGEVNIQGKGSDGLSGTRLIIRVLNPGIGSNDELDTMDINTAINHIGEVTTTANGIFNYTLLINNTGGITANNKEYTIKISDPNTSGGAAEKTLSYDSAAVLGEVINKARNIDTVTRILTNFRDLIIYNDSDTASVMNDSFSNQEKLNFISGKLLELPPSGLSDLKNKIKTAAGQYSQGTSNPEPRGGSRGGGGGSSTNVSFNPVSEPNIISTPILFKDIDDVPWAKESIMKLAMDGRVNGYGDEFRPMNNITRGEFVKTVILALNLLDESAETEYTDVSADHWAYKYIASAQEKGIVNGVDNNTFGIDVKISRQEMAAVIYRAVRITGRQLTEKNEKREFIDQTQIAEYAVEAIDEMQKAGIINGYEDRSFRPEENATRAQAARMVFSLIYNL